VLDRKCIIVKSATIDSDEVLRREASIFGRYLIRRPPDESAVTLYVNAVKARATTLSERERKCLAFIRRHPWALGFVDAGLTLLDSAAELRHRLYVMFSILESSPHYHDRFLPTRRGWWYPIAFGTTVIIGVTRMIIGTILVKVIVQ
jgi:hypothetical protein